MRHRFLVILCLCFTVSLPAQVLDHRQGEVIVQFGAHVDAKGWIASKTEFTDYRPLGFTLNAYLLSFDFNQHSFPELRRRYWPDPAVEVWQQNHLLQLRARPNDPRYDDQWQYRNTGQLAGVIGADHNVEPAWDITTGGVTVNGDTIVVAVLDDGVDTDHEDLINNLWRNHDEIPGNGIDDDNNGYIDDYLGWNTAGGGPGDGNVDAGAGNHGTPVAGIIGAQGNNNLGVAGTNWNVKLMTIRNNFASSEAEVIQAYSYALEARERYDQTGGAEGAYVVATNASWGRPFGRPEESPLWCGLYDRLGTAGILNAGATDNLSINVEEEGDLPSLCPSEHLVIVTNLTTFDVKDAAAFGRISVDLGAYGRDVFNTTVGNNYGYFDGTSAATPGVAGAIALLYSTPCAAFGELLEADPALATLRVRAALLSSVQPNASLTGITVTGGRLDIAAAMDQLLADFSADGLASCDACLPPTSFTVAPVAGSATELTVDWRAAASLENITLRYRPSGTEEWEELPAVTAPYEITGLAACVSYDLQVVGDCGGTPAATAILQATTDGCCVIPEDFSVIATPNQVFEVTWTQLLAAERYRVRYRRQGDTNWLVRTSRGTGQLLLAGGIEPCTNYEFEFQTDCDTLLTDFGRRATVLSFGCGSCNEKTYCTPERYDNGQEWIREVNLGNILVQRSGPEAGGYRSFGEVTPRPFVRGGAYPLEITPAFQAGTGVDGFRVYVDWDQNGFFTENEVAAEMNNAVNQPARAVITVPEDAALLLTRMRVIMQFQGANDDCPINNEFGEAEDYCINIAAADPACPPPVPGSLRINYDETADLTRLSWQSSNAVGGRYRVRYRLRGSAAAWVETDVEGIQLNISGLDLCGAYEFELASLCGDTPGVYRLFYFNDDCTGTRDNRLPAAAWSVFPNPAAERTTVTWRAGLRPTTLELFAADGRLQQQLTPSRGGSAQLDLTGLPGGVYVLRIRTADGRAGVRKVIVR